MIVESNELYEQIAKEYGLKPYQVKVICEYPIRLMVEAMKTRSTKAILLPNFGKLVMKNYFLKKHGYKVSNKRIYKFSGSNRTAKASR